MNEALVLAPLIITFVSSIFLITCSHPISSPPKWTQFFSAVSLFTQFICALLLGFQTYTQGPIVIHVGGWEAPFGISLYGDTFSALMIAVCSLVGFAGMLYFPSAREAIPKERLGLVRPLTLFLFIGVNGAFLAGDLFNLYVWFEVLLISSFALLSLAGNYESRAIKGAMKYVVINLLSSTLFLIGIALIYAKTGTLNLKDLYTKTQLLLSIKDQYLIAPFFLAAFGIKSAIFPLFFWLPDSYPTATPSISGIFAGILTKVGVYAFLRIVPLLFSDIFFDMRPVLITLGALSMIIGVAAAATRKSTREILSYHIISQIGYMIFAFGLGTEAGFAAAVFYLIHHIVAKANLFFIGGLFEQLFGSDQLDSQGGLLKSKIILAPIFLAPAMALAGMPPFSGFFAKLLVLQAGIGAGQFWGVVIALIVGFFTLYSMTKIWNATFWGEPKKIVGRIHSRQIVAVSVLSIFSIGIGLGYFFIEPIALQVGRELAIPITSGMIP